MRQTFVIDILRQENASWQGSITWVQKKKKEYFRSTLEMIHLIDSTLEYEKKVNQIEEPAQAEPQSVEPSEDA